MSELYLVANVSHISAKKNFNLKNHMTVGKRISSSSKPDQPRFYSFICLEVTVLQRYTTVWWLLDLRQSDLFTLVSNSFVRRNFKIKNQITVGKNFSRATNLEQLRFSIFFGLEVAAFQRYTTVWWLLDLRQSDLFTLVGYSFARKNCNIKSQMTVGNNFSGATK